MRIWIMTASALAIAAPASAQVTLIPGQGVTLTRTAKGEIPAGPVYPAALGAEDMEPLSQMLKSYAIDKTAQSSTQTILPPIPMSSEGMRRTPVKPQQVEMTFVVVDGKDSVLVVRNGFEQGFTYRATITARGRGRPTDVCLVMPGKRGYEHWPYPIDKIELSAFTLEDWSPSDPLPCR